LLVTPPDTRSNTQRIFLPRSSLRELTLVAVIGAPAVKSSRKPPAREQADLFPLVTPKAL
jgi:hypothetical protein